MIAHATDCACMVASPPTDAEEFAAGDPFVLNGVVTGWSIREWNEVLYQP